MLQGLVVKESLGLLELLALEVVKELLELRVLQGLVVKDLLELLGLLDLRVVKEPLELRVLQGLLGLLASEEVKEQLE